MRVRLRDLQFVGAPSKPSFGLGGMELSAICRQLSVKTKDGCHSERSGAEPRNLQFMGIADIVPKR
jgi:hypothetical protein